MAITTDSHQGIVISGVRVSEIGLSKTLNNYTLDEIFQSAYCGEYDVLRENNHVSVADESFSEGNPDFNYPLTYVSGNWADGGDVANYTDPDGLYGKVIWLYNTGTFDNYLTTSRFSNYKLVTEWEVNKFLTVIPQTFNRGPCNASLCPSSWDEDKAFPAIYYTPGLVISTEYHTHYGFPDDAGVAVDIKPYIITKFNGIYFIYAFNMYDILHYFYACEGPKVFAQGGIASPNEEVTLSSVISVDYFSATETGNFTYSYYPGDNGIPFRYPLGNYGEIIRAMVSKDKKYLSSWKTGGTVEAMFAGLVVCKYLTKRQDALMFYANCGIRFYAGTKLYKPIIEEGIVTGFTDDLSTPSDIDNWNGSSIHDIPDSPGGGGGGSTEDDYTDMDLGISNITLGGLTKYAILTKSELVGLIADYNGNASMAGSNFSNHIICLYRLGFPASSIATTTTGNIVMVRSAGDVDFTSQANTYNLVSRQTVFIDAGGILVPRMTNTFYDFSPYSSYELYIPGCGWIPLPDNVAGRNIHVYIIFDLPTCSAKGIVRIAGGVYGGTTIATVNGIIGASCPFTIGENGQQRAAVMSANAQVAAGIATGIVGATVNPMMAVAGGAELLSGLIGAYTAGNTNYVSTKGGAADFSMFGDGGRAVLKINSPVIDSVVNNSDFGHTVGYMCNEVGQLSNFHGFTVCANPHVHISATSTEKEEIKRLLEEGVILP